MVAAVLPVLIYGAEWEWLVPPAGLLVFVVDVLLVWWLWAAARVPAVDRSVRSADLTRPSMAPWSLISSLSALPRGSSVTTSARRRTRSAAIAVAALTAGLAVQPVVAGPAEAGVGCDGPLPPLPIVGGLLNDCDAPASVITMGPRSSSSPAAVFEMTTADPDPDDPDVTFECRLETGIAPDPLVVKEDWADCSLHNESDRSLGRMEYLDLAAGDYTFSVRASDVPNPLLAYLGDTANVEQEPATHEWTVLEGGPVDEDQAGLPQTTILKQPKRWHLFPYAEVRFESDEPAMAYVCRANGERVPCQDGVAQIFGMGAGDWKFEVAAIDLAGNIDATPAKARWILPRNNVNLNEHSKKDWTIRKKRGHFLETISLTTTKGARIEQGTKGVRELVLVTTKCPKCGRIKAVFGGKTLKKIDLRAAKQKKRKVVRLGAWRKPKSGRLVLKAVSRDKKVIVEGVGFTLRRR